MKKKWLAWLIIFALVFIFIFMSFNINTHDTIRYDNIVISVKHPVAYNLKKAPSLKSKRLMQHYHLELKDYDLSLFIYFITNYKYSPELIPVMISLEMNDKYSPKDKVVNVFNGRRIQMDMLYYSSNKSKSDVVKELKDKENNSRYFFRIVKIGNYTILMATHQFYQTPFDKMKYKKEVEIIRNIKIKVIDEKKIN